MAASGKILYAGGGKYTGSMGFRRIRLTQVKKYPKNHSSNGSEIATVDIVYSNNKNVGTAIMVIIGIGDCTGVVIKIFKITKAKQKLKVTGSTKTVKYF